MPKGSKASTPRPGAATPIPNGTNGAVVEATVSENNLPSVVGINYGNSYASIAVITKEGLSECIANEDGERQIPCAISFHGDETYIGSGAKQQLVKNAQNTITGFRSLLGKKFSEISQSSLSTTSATLIQHPTVPDEPAYRVTKAGAETIFTVSEVSTLFLRSLLGSAQDFLGRKVAGAVITVPTWFTSAQREALKKSAEDAGVSVLQLIDEAGAVTVATEASAPQVDRLALVVDLGQTALELTLLSIRHGLAHSLAHTTSTSINTSQIDDRLVKFFAKDFTKKTKTPLDIAPAKSGETQDLRAEAKLRLAIEHTKRTISASPGAATCSVESLKDGLDYTGTINRMRFDMEARPVYSSVVKAVQELLAPLSIDPYEIDEVVYVGGSGALPGLHEALAAILQEDLATPFNAGVVGSDPTTLLSRGAALQADLLNSIADDAELKEAFDTASQWTKGKVTSKTLGVRFLAEEGDGTWVPLVPRETALPVRRTFELNASGSRLGIELWEATEGVKIEKVKPPKPEEDDEAEQLEDEEEEEDIEEKERIVTRDTLLGGLELTASGKVRLQILIQDNSEVAFSAWEVGKEGEKVSISIPGA